MRTIRPEDVKRISNLEGAGIRGGIHSQHTWLVALHDGSLWIAKNTKTEERDEVFTYELARLMFRSIVPETTVTDLPKIGWVSIQRKVSGVPAGRVDGLHGYFHGNDEMLADLVAMLVLDYLIGNPDRHSNNWFVLHNDRLAAIDNGWAGEDMAMSFADVFQPARLAGMMEDERLWPQLLKGIAVLIQDLEGRGDEVRALAEAIGIDKKEAVDMVRLWEPKLASLTRLIHAEAGRVEKARVYITPGQQPPMGVSVEEGPRGGHYYESEGIPRGDVSERFRENPEEVAEWARRHKDPTIEHPESEFGTPPEGDVDALFSWFENEWESVDEKRQQRVKDYFASVWQTDAADIEVMAIDPDDLNISVQMVLSDPETGKKMGRMDRTFHKEGARVHHDVFIIEAWARGRGTALAINRQAEENYRKMGFKYVDLQADIDIGKYAWAQQGYNFADEYEASSAMHNLIRFRWEQNDSYWDDRIKEVDLAWSRQEITDEEHQSMLSELNGLRHSEDPTDEFEKEMVANYDFADAWELAAMDDGESYSGMPLGKAFMISDYMSEWAAYKNLDPGSDGARVGEIYYDKKKHKIKGKGKVVAMLKAEGGRIPVELPAGSKVREGVTDEGAHDIDEDTDQEWRDALEELNFQGAIEKARVYIEPGTQPPPGAQMETGPRGGTYYETGGRGTTREKPKEDYTVWDSAAYYGADSELDLTDEAYYGRQEAFIAAVKPAQIAQSQHAAALVEYKRRAYNPINKFLRGQRPDLSKQNRRILEGIEEALQGIPGLAQNVTVYRGVGRKMLKTLRVGDHFKDSGFVSTSIGQRFAENWAGAMIVIQVPAGAKGLWMEQPYVPDPRYSGVRTEQELLFPRGREFEVVEKGQHNGKPTVVVRMIA